MYSGGVYLDSKTGYIHGAYIDGGTISGAAISGGTITGGTITGGSISGATISASGFVKCSGLTVDGKSYGMSMASMIMSGSYNMGQTATVSNGISSPSTTTITYVTGGKITGNAQVGFNLDLYTSSTTVVTGVKDNTITIHYITPNEVTMKNIRYLGVEEK